jgi:hypothetical protein
MPTFNPIPSTEPFMLADKFVNLIMGPVGSTKTTAAIIKIIHEAKRVAPCPDGIRRSRGVVIRNTRAQLSDTTIPDFLKWFPDGDAGVFMKTNLNFTIRLDDVECEILFRGLDDTNDVRRLLSLQLSFAFMDEFREIHPEIFHALTGRLGRYPDKTMNGVGCCEIQPDGTAKQIHKVWGASNPPDSDTFWEEYINNPPKNTSITIQPSGRSPEADWLHCLPEGYYENLAEGKTEDWIAVYIDGEFGRSLHGQPVFRCFDRATHVAKHSITANFSDTQQSLLPSVQPTTLIIGVDAGLNPTAVITQQTYDGRMLVLDSITGHDGGMGALRFCRERLKPLLTNKFPRHKHLIIIDPAAFQRAQTDEKTVADIFKAEGFVVKAAKTNNIAARLASVEAFLTKTVNGNSGFLVDPSCAPIISGLAGKYRYKINTKGEREATPEKAHPVSDYMDALQYACLHSDNSGIFGGNLMNAQRREIAPSPFRWAV